MHNGYAYLGGFWAYLSISSEHFFGAEHRYLTIFARQNILTWAVFYNWAILSQHYFLAEPESKSIFHWLSIKIWPRLVIWAFFASWAILIELFLSSKGPSEYYESKKWVGGCVLNLKMLKDAYGAGRWVGLKCLNAYGCILWVLVCGSEIS